MTSRLKQTAIRVEPEILEGLQLVKDRDGALISEQVRRTLRAWLDSKDVKLQAKPAPAPERARGVRTADCVPGASLVLASALSFGLLQSSPPQQPVKVYAFTLQADASGVVAPDFKDRLDSLVDLKSQLFLGRNPVLRVVPKPEDAQVLVEVLGREADPKDRDIRTVRVKVSSGPHSHVFAGRDNDGSWTRAAGDAS